MIKGREEDLNGVRGSRLILHAENGHAWETNKLWMIPNVCAQGMKHSSMLSRRYSHRKHHFKDEMVETRMRPGQRLERRSGQSSEDGRKAPQRNKSAELADAWKKNAQRSLDKWIEDEAEVANWKSPMKRHDTRTIPLESTLARDFFLSKRQENLW